METMEPTDPPEPPEPEATPEPPFTPEGNLSLIDDIPYQSKQFITVQSNSTALRREIQEETGCTCNVINELGYIYENRAYCNLQQYSYFFTVTTTGPSTAPAFTSEEIIVGTKLKWCTLEEMVSLIENGKPNTNQQIYLKARDTAATKEYLGLSPDICAN